MSRNPNQYHEGANPFLEIPPVAKTVSELLSQLAGAASVSWNPKPEGVFDPTWANYLVEQAEIALAQIQGRELPSVPTVVELALNFAKQFSPDKGQSHKNEIVDSLVALGVPRAKALEWVQ